MTDSPAAFPVLALILVSADDGLAPIQAKAPLSSWNVGLTGRFLTLMSKVPPPGFTDLIPLDKPRPLAHPIGITMPQPTTSTTWRRWSCWTIGKSCPQQDLCESEGLLQNDDPEVAT